MKRSAWAAVAVLVLFSLSAARADEAGDATLLVTVTAKEGGALAGARVWAWDENGQWKGITDAQGKATLGGLPETTVVVFADAEGRVGLHQTGVELHAGKVASASLALEKGLPFDGRVVDEGGKPVADAWIEVDAGGTFQGYMEGYPNHPPFAYATTDEEGHFHVPGIPPTAVATVVVEAEGYEGASVAVRGFGDVVRPPDLVIQLGRGGGVSGLVVDPRGQPVAGATVLVIPADDEMLRQSPHMFHSTDEGGMAQAGKTEAGEDGHYEMGGLGLGKAVLLAAEAPGFARSVWVGPLTPTKEKPLLQANLVLRGAVSLIVRLTDAAGKPVEGARFDVDSPWGGSEPQVDAPGVYRFADLVPGEHELSLSVKGYLPVQEKVTLGEGETKELPITLDPGVTIAGTVVDESGKPLAGVSVSAVRTEKDEKGWHDSSGTSADTDEGGHFEVKGLRPGHYDLDVMGRGIDLAKKVPVVAPDEAVKLVARHLGTATLRFKAPDGAPLPDSAFVWRHQPDGSGSGGGEALKDGVLRLEGFQGPERITVDIDGYVRVEREVAGKPGVDLDLGTVALDPGVTLRGRVVDRDGRPVPAATVSHEDWARANTRPDGTFQLEHVPKGTITIDIEADGYLTDHLQADAGGSKELVATISHGGLLTGVVRDAEGAPAEGTDLTIQRPGATPDSPWEDVDDTWIDSSGAYEFRVPEGRYRLVVKGEEGKTTVVLKTLAVKEGETQTVDLALGG